MDPQPPPICREAWEGCSVLLDINDGDRLAFFRLTPGATVKIGNKTCSLKPLVGRPFGSLFRLGAGGLVPCAAADATSRDHNTPDDANGQTQDETRDNRSLVDNNTAQNLSSDDIEAMKRDGATGDEIVEALIANSSTFGNKTVFSQEKYKLKKQKKYAPKVLLRRPSARSICETYFKKTPARIGFMRVDTLSLLLSMANIGAYSDVLVVDMVGGTGYVCSTYLGSAPSSIDIIRMYNLSSDMVSRIVQAPISALCSMQSSGNTPSVVNSSAEGEMIEPAVDEDAQSSLAQQVDTAVPDEKAQLSTDQPSDMEVSEPSLDEHLVQDENSSLGGKDSDGTLNASKPPKPGKAPSPEKMKYWKEHGFSSLIVAAPGHEVERLVADMLPLLSYSAPFAIYHQHLEPLAKCMHSLQLSKMAIGLQLSEPWLREYQVLPSRTHPHMQMNAFGGYILNGIRIHNPDRVVANK
ncbi:tRNA (adenine(58)-N(1))-methyltransferase non-catalytic subunit trm6 [Zea mays]|uniref:tRNA (adenine(58)-N(1))-methyltransferase non-catalytic subunit TRM6 n=2 Tax=Zea mays TaxID=4577 RepID=A0A3L6FAW0_MAIZE|nr:eukaryotic initiation factor 3 gamma subunit family protein [Zea mays]PWZ30077.1 hypothetical protein Zm00014a_020338 [Zea mays]PWZ30078.1 tRNA (adenine(58)-N(1))-methyltransferase non-catalytic subunit trm6 [Zea mays]